MLSVSRLHGLYVNHPLTVSGPTLTARHMLNLMEMFLHVELNRTLIAHIKLLSCHQGAVQAENITG